MVNIPAWLAALTLLSTTPSCVHCKLHRFSRTCVRKHASAWPFSAARESQTPFPATS